MQAAAANKKDAAMFSRMFKPSKEKPAATTDAKENAPVANGHDKADVVVDAQNIVANAQKVVSDAAAEPMDADVSPTGEDTAETVSAAALK